MLTASVAGWVVLALVVAAARRLPGAWGQPVEQEVLRPRVPLTRALLPWTVAASFCLVGWGLADRRGLELDVADVRVRVPAARSADPPWAREQRSELDKIRDDVHRGSASLERYLEARRALAAALERRAVDGGPDEPSGE